MLSGGYRHDLRWIRILGLILWLLTGCQSEADHRVTISFWAMGQEGEWVKSLLPEFERLNPDIVVKVQSVPWSAAHEKLLTAYAGDSLPDLFQLGNTILPEMAALKAIAPLNEAALSLPMDDFFPGIVSTNRLGQVLYGIPWYVDTRIIFYRKDSLAEAGWDHPPDTWPDWLKAMQAIRQKHRFALFLPVNDWRMPVILGLQQNSSLLRDHDRFGNFTEDSFKHAFDFYLDFFRLGLAPRLAESEIANLYQEFGQAYFSILITGPWNLAEFRRRLPDESVWATTPLPGASLAGGASLAISHRSEHKAQAWKLIAFLSQTRQQVEFYRLSGDLPVRRSAFEDDLLKKDEKIKAFQKQLDCLLETPKIPEWEHIASELGVSVERVVRMELSQDEALTELNLKVDAILEKRRWLMANTNQPRIESKMLSDPFRSSP